MSITHVLCFDGTNNEFGRENTNVVRLAQVLRRDPDAAQRLYYDPGVGTLPEPGVLSKATAKWSTLLGLAIGAGLTTNVEQGYAYLMEYWQPGDRIFLFGFSRGAYTARVLAALLHTVGLLPRGSDNLIPYTIQLLKGVRSERHSLRPHGAHYDPNRNPQSPLPSPLLKRRGASSRVRWQNLCDQFRETFSRPHPDTPDRRFPVDFLGLWDTVASVGWAWDPTKYPYTTHNPSVRCIRHAVSLDERRWFFRQNLVQRASDTQDLLELWFPGVHADVGGGYPTRDAKTGGVSPKQLWRIPFEWMLDQAIAKGLDVDPVRRQQVLAQARPEGALCHLPPNESLTWKWWPAEFVPKMSKRRGASWPRPSLGLFGRRTLNPGALLHQSLVRRLVETDSPHPNLTNAFRSSLTATDAAHPYIEYRPDPSTTPTLQPLNTR